MSEYIEQKLERKDFNKNVPLGGIFMLDDDKEEAEEPEKQEDNHEEQEYNIPLPYPLTFVDKVLYI